MSKTLFVVILRYQAPLDMIDALRDAHIQFLKTYYEDGTFLVSGPQIPRQGGVILAKAINQSVLEEILVQDPFVVKNLVTYELIPFTPTLWCSSFDEVLNKDAYDPMNLQEELLAREPIFHHPESFGTSFEDIDVQMCEEFWEVGAFGTVYSRTCVLDELSRRYQDPLYRDIWEIKDFQLTKIAVHNYLATYVLIQNKQRITRRATLWRWEEGSWKILYHQGTVVTNGSE